MANQNFFRVMQGGTWQVSSEADWPVLTCQLELGDFATATPAQFPNYQSFKNYSGLYHQQQAINSRYNGNDGSLVHYMYTSWWGTSSFSDGSPYKQLVYQYMYSSSDSTAPNLGSFEPWQSPTNNTASLTLNAATLGSGLSPAFGAIQSIQVPDTGSVVQFGVRQGSALSNITQYQLNSNFDITTLNTSTRHVRRIAAVTQSLTKNVDQISFGYTGSHLYQFHREVDFTAENSPTWTCCTIFHLSRPYDLASSTSTSSFCIEEELGIDSYPFENVSKVNCTVVNISQSNYGYPFQWASSSFFYVNSANDYVRSFIVNRAGNIEGSVVTLSPSDFPREIHYVSPFTYQNNNTYQYTQLMVSRSLSPIDSNNINHNVERTGSCMSPYVKPTGWFQL
tara:strand:+ start:7487 stop:8668 length:1182 start_codon:yes stop_codon:yes gene_type:complete